MVTVLNATFTLQITLFPLTIKNFVESVICYSYFKFLLFFIKKS